MQKMNDQNKEAHLIGSLMDSLGKGGEDDVFLTPSSVGINNSSPIYANNPWAFAGYQQYPPNQGVGRWPPPPMYAVRPPPTNVYGGNSADISSNYARFSPQKLNSVGNYSNFNPCNVNQQQWESFYTPFGPVKAPIVAEQQIIQPPPLSTKVAESSSSSASSPKLPSKGISYRDVALKPPLPNKNNASAGTVNANLVKTNGDLSPPLSHNMQIYGSRNVVASYDLQMQYLNSSSNQIRKNSAPGAACRQSSSDSLSESGGGHLHKLSNNDSDSESERSAQSQNLISNNNTSASAGRRSSTTADNVRKIENMLRKVVEDERTSANVLQKHTTTNTQPADFQKIVRRKGKSTVIPASSASPPTSIGGQILQQTTNNAPESAGKKSSKLQQTQSGDTVGRYGSLTTSSQKSNGETSKKNTATSSTPTFNHRNLALSFGGQYQKLNNEQYKFYSNNKSPTHKSAYINNDLTSSSSTKDFDDYSCPDDDDDDEEEMEEIVEDSADKLSNNSNNASNYGSGVIASSKNMAAAAAVVKGRNKKSKRTDSDLGDRYKRKKKQDNVLLAWFAYVFFVVAQNVHNAVLWLVNLVTDIGTQLADVFIYCTKLCYTKVCSSLLRAWYKLGERCRTILLGFRQKEWTLLFWWKNRKKRNSDEFGLDKNIDLPNTGEEAMKRLLMCRGQDAYSILGLKPDCTDEEVKHYYRRQAVLVHPDKNSSYGADEAFKILAAAFELIGTYEHRRQYDLENMHRTKAMKDLEEMFARLREKMEEVRSTMHCDCGKKHRRFPSDRSLSAARYCRKCKDHHAAREGDIWAESHWFGFLWYYYACMEGIIYDITEWAGCQKNNLKHIKPNTHLVQYRLITGRNARKPTTDAKGLSDADAEEFLNRLLEENLNSAAGTPSTRQDFAGQNAAVPPQSKFRPPTCPGDSRPRKAGRRRKGRVN